MKLVTNEEEAVVPEAEEAVSMTDPEEMEAVSMIDLEETNQGKQGPVLTASICLKLSS